jgi:hypothetical protein
MMVYVDAEKICGQSGTTICTAPQACIPSHSRDSVPLNTSMTLNILDIRKRGDGNGQRRKVKLKFTARAHSSADYHSWQVIHNYKHRDSNAL